MQPTRVQRIRQRTLVFALPMVDGIQKCLNARNHAHLREMLVHLYLQIRFVAHFLGEQVAHHGVGPATVVGQIHCEQARVAAHKLRTRKHMLTERPIHIGMVDGNVQIVRVQMAYRDHFLPAIEQRIGNAHVECWVGNAVLACDNHQHALTGCKACQQLLALFLGFARELLHGEPAREHGLRAFLRREAQTGTHAQKSRCKRLLAKVHIHERAYERDATPFEIERIGHQARRHLHIRAGVVVAHLAFDMANSVHRRHEHVIDARIHQLRHVPIHQLHRVARFTLGVFLRAAHRVFARRVGQKHVEAQLAEKRVHHGEQFVQHQTARHAHRFLRGVARGVVAFQIEFLGLTEEGAVGLHVGRIRGALRATRAR